MKHLNKIKKETIITEAKPTGKLLSSLYRASSIGKTENDADTFIRSGSWLLDFYAQAWAMRKNPDQALDLFKMNDLAS